MKLAKFAKSAIGRGRITLHYTQRGRAWIGNGVAMYKATNLPPIHGLEQMRAVLDIEEKKMDKIVFDEIEADEAADVYGFDVDAGAVTERQTKKVEVAAVVGNKLVKALTYDDGEVIFYDDALLDPVRDVINENEYAELAVQETPYGVPVIVVKDGFEVIAVITPMEVITKDYLKKLAEFESLCAGAYEFERMRALKKAESKKEETEGEE